MNNTKLPVPPVAARKPHDVKAPHGAVRQDEYYWLRDDRRQAPEVLDYLKAENAYTEAVMAPLRAFEDKLYQEFVGRIKQDDSSVPYLHATLHECRAGNTVVALHLHILNDTGYDV